MPSRRDFVVPWGGKSPWLGLGAQPPTAEWGAMVFVAKDYLAIVPHIALFPILAIFLTVLSFDFLGDGLRDALDPGCRVRLKSLIEHRA